MDDFNEAEIAIWRVRFRAYDEDELRRIVEEGGQLAALAYGQLVARGLVEVTWEDRPSLSPQE